jgi:hypothetical protein
VNWYSPYPYCTSSSTEKAPTDSLSDSESHSLDTPIRSRHCLAVTSSTLSSWFSLSSSTSLRCAIAFKDIGEHQQAVSGASITPSSTFTLPFLFLLLVEPGVIRDACKLLPSLRTSPIVFVTIRNRQYQKQPCKTTQPTERSDFFRPALLFCKVAENRFLQIVV